MKKIFIFSTVNVTLPMKVRNNGTMYLHVFLVPPGQDPFVSHYTVHRYTAITTYSLPKSEVFSLMGDAPKVRTDLYHCPFSFVFIQDFKDGVLSAFEYHCTGCYNSNYCKIYWSDTDPIGADLHIY
jgi:hypothetical protein